jgi:16S rRNA (adenine1518-N6/adenine1519-N6)-dimethyltransferase
MLRHRSEGVARSSLHMQGQAIDIRLADVPRHAFIPAPKVQSAVLRLTAGGLEPTTDPQVFAAYLELVERVFKHRRKQVSNAMRLAYSHLSQPEVDAVLTDAEVDGALRPQDVSAEQFLRIAAALSRKAQPPVNG